MAFNEKICYNKGCGKTYTEEENSEGSCIFHKGDPIFHDAYKYWSCCSKKHSNFTDFLNTPGCCIGKHSNIKPEIPKNNQEEKVTNVCKSDEDIQAERPNLNEPLMKLKSTKDSDYTPEAAEAKAAESNGNKISMDEICKHHSCNITYADALKDDSICFFHPGQPVFHEGMKYWSCCQRKTSDFSTFLNQKGCEEGKHIWEKKDEVSENRECKYDWYQTGTHVFISMYIKNPDPSTSFVDANRVSLKIHIEYMADVLQTFDKTIILFEPIDLSQSSVTYYASKVEIKLRKCRGASWKTLEFKTY